MKYWLYLAGAILFEVLGTSSMKYAQLHSPVAGMIIMYIFIGFSYFCLAKAVTVIPIGVAYAFWEGAGLVIITLVSFFVFREALSPLQFGAIGMILVGVMLINYGTAKGSIKGAGR